MLTPDQVTYVKAALLRNLPNNRGFWRLRYLKTDHQWAILFPVPQQAHQLFMTIPEEPHEADILRVVKATLDHRFREVSAANLSSLIGVLTGLLNAIKEQIKP